ncbi:hypothetical protein C3D80_16375 [Cronobacter sakazakii]|jgi:predicted kinase|uniref:Zeta toxin n=7 Tax=Gammaproteobacteria TaxID=1236 RepID=A0A4U9IQF2_9ENTR|nr:MULTISPECIES: AAA family ATPase [Enterobacterales]EAX3870990.1 hypothetical protein [Salmonella enterica]ECS8450508.1 hypothetical protein [Salmonella enterica subsp. enterica serovar Uganda]EEW1970592.1 hypothetical protein [Escherichia coli]ELI8991124.1 AAA family ATPase [Klebsiella variicola]MCS6052704.1 AAA family ATPase [Klebsiella variicola subsp. variicola]MDU3076733.1 AAA family ATPase [Mixta calida]PXY63099.1 hypothetical protein DMY04_18350 [Enterobacter hormaechei subsp. steige
MNNYMTAQEDMWLMAINKVKSPTVFMLHGFLGSGKTTFARHLEHKYTALRFTHDEWMQQLYGIDPPQANFADYAQRVFNVMEPLWTRCVELNNNVILDFGFWSREERVRVREIITAHNGQAVLCRLSCPDDIAWERIQKRNKTPTNSLYIARETFDLLHERFEPLTPDEDFTEVSDNGSCRYMQ